MKMRLIALQKKATELVAQMEAYAAKDMSAEDETAFKAAQAELAKTKTDIANIETTLAEKQAQADSVKRNATAVIEPETKIAATPKIRMALKNFKGPDAEKRAVAATHWFAAISGNKSAAAWCARNGLPLYEATGQLEGTNTAGGYTVPDSLSGDIIALMNEYGIFRQNAKIVPMGSDKMSIPRRTGGLTGYWVGEAASATASTKAWGLVTLSAKKLAAMAYTTNELIQDSIVNVVDDLMGEIAYVFAYNEDLAGFIGDGTSTYGGIVGLSSALSTAAFGSTGAVATNYGGGVVADGNAASEFTLANFATTAGKLPTYARRNAKWYMSPSYYAQTVERLLVALSGNTLVEVQDGVRRPIFLGYPVIFTEAMPSTDTNSQCAALFGDLSLAAKMGDRQSIALKVSGDAYVNSTSMFETDQVAIMGTERIDIVVHDVGTGTAGSSAAVAGPIVGLFNKSS